MDNYHSRTASAPLMFPQLNSKRTANNRNGVIAIFGVILASLWLFSTIQLIQARHEIRTLRGEFVGRAEFQQVAEDVSEHDEMLETVGDDVTILEAEVKALAAKKGARKVRP